MKSFLNVVLMGFLFTLFVDGGVQASTAKESKTEKLNEDLHQEEKIQSQVISAPDSFISEKKLLSGSHWILGKRNYVLKTPYGDISATSGDFFIRFENSDGNNRITVVNHEGELTVRLRDQSVLQVPPGFQFWFSEVGPDRMNRIGLIEPVDLKEHVVTLGQLWPSSENSLKNQLLKYQSHWGDRTAKAAEYYKSLAKRKIASVQQEEDRQQSLKRAQENQKQANRKIYFERTFGR